MSITSFIVTVPKNTLENNKYTDELEIMNGTINRIDIGFQDGCANLVKIQLYYRLKQIVPFIEGQYLSWNDHIFSIPVNLKITGIKDILTVKASSEGTYYPHDIYFWFYFTDVDNNNQQSLISRLLGQIPTREILS